MKKGIIIQARCSSKRLPKKVLLPIEKTNVLGFLYNRIKSLNKNFEIIVATSTKEIDDNIEKFCKKEKIEVFRGDEDNVLERFYECSIKYNLQIIMRLTADCPLICPKQLKNLYGFYKQYNLDYTFFDESFPEGICADLFSFKSLEKVYKNTNHPEDLEHVTPYMHKNKKDFNIRGFSLNKSFNNLRFTIDTDLDYLVVKKITNSLYKKFGYEFDMYKILEFLEQNNEIININNKIKRNESFNVFDL